VKVDRTSKDLDTCESGQALLIQVKVGRTLKDLDTSESGQD